MALKGTEYIDRCKEFENLQLKQFMMDILADDTEYTNTPSIFENQDLEDLPGVKTYKQKLKKLRFLLLDEANSLTKD